jgi:hypothetical protein
VSHHRGSTPSRWAAVPSFGRVVKLEVQGSEWVGMLQAREPPLLHCLQVAREARSYGFKLKSVLGWRKNIGVEDQRGVVQA